MNKKMFTSWQSCHGAIRSDGWEHTMDLSMHGMNHMELVASYNIQMEVTSKDHGSWARKMDQERKSGRTELVSKDTTDKICDLVRALSNGQMANATTAIGYITIDMAKVAMFGRMDATTTEIGGED
jgi:predicted O-methyltransferase YrrM